jgi:hypothetical protein
MVFCVNLSHMQRKYSIIDLISGFSMKNWILYIIFIFLSCFLSWSGSWTWKKLRWLYTKVDYIHFEYKFVGFLFHFWIQRKKLSPGHYFHNFSRFPAVKRLVSGKNRQRSLQTLEYKIVSFYFRFGFGVKNWLFSIIFIIFGDRIPEIFVCD